MTEDDAFDCTPAELVVLVYHLAGGAIPLDEQAEALFAAEGRSAAEVEEALEERGLLLRLPFEESVGVVGEVAALLRAALDPERLLHLRRYAAGRERTSTFNLAEGAWVRHDADDGAAHRFALVGGNVALLDALASMGSTATETRALLLRVDAPGDPAARAASLGWLAAYGELALLTSEDREARPVTPAELRHALADFLSS